FDFVNNQSRVDYVISNYDLPEETKSLIVWLKKTIYKTLLKSSGTVKDSEYHKVISALLNIIGSLSGTQIPAGFEEYSGLTVNVSEKPEETDKPAFVEYCRCVVNRITKIETGATGYNYFYIYCSSDEEPGNFSLRVLNYHFDDFIHLHENIRKFTTLGIHNFEQGKIYGNFFISTPRTLIVIEPDILIEASEVAECFNGKDLNPYSYFIRKLLPSYSSLPAFKGTLINTLFDAIIINPGVSPEDVIISSIRSNPLIALRFDDDRINEIAESAVKSHYNKLKEVLNTKSSDNIRIEPTFFAPQYGLAGRLDALSVPADDESKRNIVELKSGREHKTSVWANHRMQITAYNLLLKSAYGKERKGSSFILYSGSEKSPYRNISVTPVDEKKVIMMRNKIVSELLKLAENRFDLLSLIMNSDIDVPVFHVNELKNFKNLLKKATDVEQKYYRYLISFLVREYKCSKTGTDNFTDGSDNGFAGLWLNTEEDKENGYNLIRNLELVKFEENKGLIHFRYEKNNHNFREGDYAIMYSVSANTENPVKGEIMRGNISLISDDTVIFTLRNKQIYNDFFILNSRWNIEHDIIESNFWSTARSLYGFLNAPAEKKELIMGLRKPALLNKDFGKISGLSDDQNENIMKAINARDHFLLQGPPGTGKTSTALINIVRNIRESGKKTFILAYTNRAVNEICTKFDDNKIRYRKLGVNTENMAESCKGSALKDILGYINNEYRNHDVFVSTVTAFNNRVDDLGEIFSFDNVIIDEASQITEADITGIISRFTKFILIGDQNQLPSVVVQSPKSSLVKDSSLKSIGLENLNISYFERMYNICVKNNWHESIGMLKNQYRMHADVADLVNNAYKGELKPALDAQTKPFRLYNAKSADKLEKALSSSRTIFFGSAFEKTSKTNRDEAGKTLRILKLLKSVYGSSLSEEKAGVVTPWRAQIALIKSLTAGDDVLKNITVDTVERFQGSERNIIIISLAVYNSLQVSRMQSLNTDNIDRKLLVAISRAKEQVIILGNESVLTESDNYRQLLNVIKSKKGYFGYNESVSIFL
ncbi:MAG: AAA domain-containing protein, partial [Ignavibacteria bacterium]|nr:AAA domain-containing protein [Ignavibacteria bacterium]